MELEQVKQKREQLQSEINTKVEELNAIKENKASLEAKLNAKREEIATAEQSIFDKREDLKKLEITLEVMNR